MMRIGPYQLEMPVLLAPMAGITDLPFRNAVRRFGIGLTVAEMVSARPQLQDSRKSRQRRISTTEPLPRAIQIVGHDPSEMASAAAHNEALGAGLIDINMGCPAKKVFRKAAGSALLADERRVRSIVEAVVAAVSVPVSLKIRTGVSPERNNAIEIARIAEDAGIQSLVIHGRSRACMFRGVAEHETARRVKQAVAIPVVVNGDIDSPEKARMVLSQTGADAVMIGRAAQGQPWLPSMIGASLDPSLQQTAVPDLGAQKQACIRHIREIHDHYGPALGVKIARKHIRWYLQFFPDGPALSQQINRIDAPEQVIDRLLGFYEQQIARHFLTATQSGLAA